MNGPNTALHPTPTASLTRRSRARVSAKTLAMANQGSPSLRR